MTIQYRQIEYALVQGVGRNIWKWSSSVAGVVITGHQHTKAAAALAAEKAIDRALAVKRCGSYRRWISEPRRQSMGTGRLKMWNDDGGLGSLQTTAAALTLSCTSTS